MTSPTAPPARSSALRSRSEHLPLILSVDNPEAIATALETAVLAERPVLIYFLIRLPNEELLGFRAVLQRGDEEHQRVGARFFRRLAQVTARSGAAAVLGAEGRPEHLALEMAYRSWFASRMNANLTKIVAKIRPESDPFEVTTDGQTTMSLLMRESPDGWTDPSVLARDLIEHTSHPISRGHDFAVAHDSPHVVAPLSGSITGDWFLQVVGALALLAPVAYLILVFRKRLTNHAKDRDGEWKHVRSSGKRPVEHERHEANAPSLFDE